MSELPDEPPPSRRRTPKNGRRPRFVLPDDHHDARVGEAIEAFLDGPPQRSRQAKRARAGRDTLRSVPRRIPLDTRQDWDVALRREDARVARYGRPAAVLVVRIETARPGSADRLAGRVGDIVRELVRETDRVSRSSEDRFQILLPETDEAAADALGDRIRGACMTLLSVADGGLEIVVAAASPGHGETLHDALQSAREAVAA